MYSPDEKEFLKLTRQGNLIPVYREILGDLDTPVSAYYKLAQKARFSFLLESVEGEEKVARYSFMAKDPELVIRGKDDQIELISFKQGKKKKELHQITDSPLTLIREIMARYRFVGVPGLPRFCGGLVGYMGFDVVRFFERLPNKPPDDLRLPDILLMLAKDLVIFDHRNHKIQISHCVYIPPRSSRQKKIRAYRRALKSIDAIAQKIQRPLPAVKPAQKASATKPLPVISNFTKKEFEDIVSAAKKKIRAGDIIQTVLSQRFTVELRTQPFHIYRMLRALNPSPYMYFLHCDNLQVIGSSPELLVRCEDGVVETRPIAGTRPRGKNEVEDAALARELLNDPKEKAEHIMLVDLGRNDLGRVCRQGSVRLSEFMSVEKYSHVMHIVSNVTGRLKPGKDAFDVLKATFPAGTVSGAPKIRAMEIIDELENVSRGPYAGCICYFSFSGNFDSCITIRTIVSTENKAYLQAGAGIVADSQPTKEFSETVNKARAQIQAIEKAHEHFGTKS